MKTNLKPKPKANSLITAGNLLSAALAAETERTAETVPPGWHTTEELQIQLGKSRAVTSRLLNHLVTRGEWQMRKFKILSGSRVYPVPHYIAAKK